ncbi:MAG: ATP-dependent DNA helicase RecG [Lacticaseibacillus absianus]
MTINEAAFSPATDLKGVGVKTGEGLRTLGICSIYDLLFYFPYRYDELASLPLDQLMDGQKVMLKGIVATTPYQNFFGYHKSRVSFKMRIDHDIIMVNFFNQPWLTKQLEIGQEVAIYGKYNLAKQSLSAYKLVAKSHGDDGMAPVYSVNRHIKQKKLQSLIDEAIAEYGSQIGNAVPDWLRKKYQLMSDQELVEGMHHPKSPAQAKAARRSAVFREFFIFQMQMALMASSNRQHQGQAKKYDLKEIAALTKALPFDLSPDQKQAINEIFADMFVDRQMHRLLQGDVGSGKTIVAVFAIYGAITAGYQAALMVPTEILASQHFKKIDDLLRPFGVRVALLTGSTKAMERREIYKELADGTINCVIGTHALIQDKVAFKKLGLVIIDEQHRFGVAQRLALLNKGDHPDLLAMTATPIPRTLALTVYGDMDLSEIRHLPAGRKPIISSWKTSSEMDQVYALMRKQLAQGFQIYAVTPLISESATIDLENAEELYKKLAHDFPDQHVVLLHGQMSGEEKEEIMSQFSAGQIDILVATSVIEVGVDVANANMMVIFDADRFGLSQLHQLRGRIGRGQTQSYCVFLADPKTAAGKQRMQIVAATTNGFKLAEEDLKMRGEGDLFGKAQSGLPEFKVGNAVTDYKTLVAAKEVASEIVASDPDLAGDELADLKRVLDYNRLVQARA